MQRLTALLEQWAKLQPSFCRFEPDTGYAVADGRGFYYIPSNPSPFTMALLQSVLQSAIASNPQLSLTLSRVAPVLTDDCWVCMISHHSIKGLTVAASGGHPAIALLDAHVQVLEAIGRREYKREIVSSGYGGGDAA